MAWKHLTQRNPAEALLVEHEAIKELDGVAALADWSRIAALLADIHTSHSGEEAWPPQCMFKALLLQSW